MTVSGSNENFENNLALKGRVDFIFFFLLLFVAMQATYSSTRDTLVERIIIDYATVKPSVTLINLLTPHEQVIADGHRIVSKYAAMSVLNGCEGVEAILLLVAAILAFSTTWRHKVWGIVAGTILVYTFNQVRIVSLYFTAVYYEALFNDIHGFIGPTLIILLACGFFLIWIRWDRQRNSSDAV